MQSQSLSQLIKGRWVDRTLLLLALLAIAMSWVFIQSSIAAGPPVAEIYHGDTLLASYRIPEPGQPSIHFEAEGELGLSEIEISSDGVRMLASPCTSQHCVLSGTHHHAGDLIACVPNRILIAIRGSRDDRFDAVVE